MWPGLFCFSSPPPPLFGQIQENGGDGLHFGAARWALLCRRLRAIHGATETLLIILFPPNCYFSHPLTVLKMNAPGSPGPEGGGTLGNPRGAAVPGSPQEGAAAGSLKTGWCVTASGFLAHAGKPRICYGTIHQEGEGKQ